MDSVKLNKILRLVFIASSFVLLLALTTVPKSNCLACEIGEDKINGYKAYQEFERECISYNKPWSPEEEISLNITNNSNFTYSEKEYVYINIDDLDNQLKIEMETINATIVGDGEEIINFSETPLQ